MLSKSVAKPSFLISAQESIWFPNHLIWNAISIGGFYKLKMALLLIFHLEYIFRSRKKALATPDSLNLYNTDRSIINKVIAI